MKLTCRDCGKRYIYEEDEFCPKCGSYNQPRESSVSAMEAELEGRFASTRAKQAGINARHRAKTAALDREHARYERASDARHEKAPPVHTHENARPSLRTAARDLQNMARDLGREAMKTPPPADRPSTRTPPYKAPGGRPVYTPPQKKKSDPTPAVIFIIIIFVINLLRILFRAF